MSIQVNVEEAKDLIIRALKANLVPMLTGSPGIGKSDLVRSIADQFNLELIDLRLAQCDPTDLLGFPHIDEETKKASYYPMNTFPLETDEIPNGKNGWLLFLDEFNHADRSVQKAAYKLVLDKMIGPFKLHDHTRIICAGNLNTDNAFVEDMSTAMQSRLCPHLELSVDLDVWLNWAVKNDIDHRITSYIKYKPNNLYNFSPDHVDKTYPCPRTWAFLSKMIKEEKQIGHNLLPLIAGTISEGAAREFVAYTKIYKDLLTVEEILKAPEKAQVPTEPAMLYALSGAIANRLTTGNAKPLLTFIFRMPIEFQIICLREAVARNPNILKESMIAEWMAKHSKELFS